MVDDGAGLVGLNKVIEAVKCGGNTETYRRIFFKELTHEEQ